MPAEEQDSNRIIEGLLDDRISVLADAHGSDVLTYFGPITWGLEEDIKIAVEEIPNRKKCLLVVLETTGGYMEVAEGIARIFRHHYECVDFIVPSYAMSAGTVLVMSGDHILMDYSSVLGPIDPQVERPPGSNNWVPALGYLEQYKKLVEKSASGELSTAELAYMVERFDPAELYRFEQDKALSTALLKDWLVKYKFKDWDETETQKKTVTAQMREDRAVEVADKLNDIDLWHTHSRGIPMEVLRRDLDLKIEDFDEDAALGPAMRDYFRLLRDYTRRRGHYALVLHTRGKYIGV